MSLQFNGTKALVTISGNLATGLAAPSSSQAIKKYYSASHALNGSAQAIITPTAGKKLYVTDFILSAPASAVTFGDNGTDFIRFSASVVYQYHLATPVQIDTALTVTGTNGQNIGNLTVVGFEE